MENKDKKQVMSFAAHPELKNKIMQLDGHTRYIGAVLAADQGLCPVCHNHWPRKDGVKVMRAAEPVKAGDAVMRVNGQEITGIILDDPIEQVDLKQHILADIIYVGHEMRGAGNLPSRDQYQASKQRKFSVKKITFAFGSYGKAIEAIKKAWGAA